MTASSKRSQVFRFGVFELDGRAHELRRRGARLRLQEQPFLVLSCLLERAGDVVTRDELRQQVWPSSVYVDFDHGLNNAIARVREVLRDSASAPRFIETLPRLGYRFICPVALAAEPAGAVTTAPIAAVTAVAATEPVQFAAAPSLPARRLVKSFSAAAAVGIAVVLGLFSGFWLAQRPADVAAHTNVAAAPRPPSVAVLPFVSLGSDPENELIADGLSEELLHKVAGIDGLKVAAATSSRAFKGTRESPAAIAQELNVTHLLEGSVRRSAKRLRITAQLIDCASGYQVWSEVYDGDSSNIPQIQEEITRSVASAMQAKLVAADRGPLARRPDSDAEGST